MLFFCSHPWDITHWKEDGMSEGSFVVPPSPLLPVQQSHLVQQKFVELPEGVQCDGEIVSCLHNRTEVPSISWDSEESKGLWGFPQSTIKFDMEGREELSLDVHVACPDPRPALLAHWTDLSTGRWHWFYPTYKTTITVISICCFLHVNIWNVHRKKKKSSNWAESDRWSWLGWLFVVSPVLHKRSPDFISTVPVVESDMS